MKGHVSAAERVSDTREKERDEAKQPLKSQGKQYYFHSLPLLSFEKGILEKPGVRRK
jgi:hypothetical protein